MLSVLEIVIGKYQKKNVIILSSDSIYDENLYILKYFIDKCVVDIKKNNDTIDFIFNDYYSLSIDIKGKYSTNENDETEYIAVLDSDREVDYAINIFGKIYLWPKIK